MHIRYPCNGLIFDIVLYFLFPLTSFAILNIRGIKFMQSPIRDGEFLDISENCVDLTLLVINNSDEFPNNTFGDASQAN